jgi:hypothetical protein
MAISAAFTVRALSNVTSAHPYRSVTSVHSPFSLCVRTPATSLSPSPFSCLNWPYDRPGLQGFVLDLRPPNEQVVSAFGLLLRPGFGWYLEILYRNSAIYFVSRYLHVIWYFVSFTYYSYSLLLFNLIYSILDSIALLYSLPHPHSPIILFLSNPTT